MTGSWNKSQQMAHVRSSLRLPLVAGGAEAAEAMVLDPLPWSRSEKNPGWNGVINI